jgi:RNA polymerase primary sigma factor
MNELGDQNVHCVCRPNSPLIGERIDMTSLLTAAVDDRVVTHDSQMTASKMPAKAPAWMRSAGLAAANSAIRPLLQDLDSADVETLRAKSKFWTQRELGHISNANFGEPGAGREIFREDLGLAPQRGELGISALRKSGVDLPSHFSRLCEAPLLTQDQERRLFERMNFLLHHASNHRNLLNPDRPSKARLLLIERLVLLAEWHRDRIVEANVRLVFSIVKKFVNPTNTFEDLLSDGIVGLIRAVEKFDFDRGFRFSTYATQVIRRNSYRTVVENQQERQKVVGGIEELEIDVCEEVRTSAISETRWHELRSRLSVMLNHLDRREKLIIRARFSLGSHRKIHTLQSIANRLGISKERVRQLEARAMTKLQGMAGGLEFGELDVS